MKVPQTNARGRGVDHTRTCSRPAQTAQLLHFFSVVVSCYTLAHTVELTDDMVELMLPNGSNSSPQYLVYVESTLPKHEEMNLDRYHIFTLLFTMTSMDKAFEVTKVKVRCIRVWWLSSSGWFLSFYRQICCEKYFWEAHQHTANSSTGIHRFTVIGSWSTELTLWFYSRPECHKIFIGVTIIIFRYEYKQLISINVFNPVDPKIFYFIYLATRYSQAKWVQVN